MNNKIGKKPNHHVPPAWATGYSWWDVSRYDVRNDHELQKPLDGLRSNHAALNKYFNLYRHGRQHLLGRGNQDAIRPKITNYRTDRIRVERAVRHNYARLKTLLRHRIRFRPADLDHGHILGARRSRLTAVFDLGTNAHSLGLPSKFVVRAPIASLINYDDPGEDHERQVRADQIVAKVRKNHQILARAKHIVHELDLGAPSNDDDFVGAMQYLNINSANAAAAVAATGQQAPWAWTPPPDLSLLPFFENGSLQDFMCKIAEWQPEFPASLSTEKRQIYREILILRIFRCLVKACCALELPPTRRRQEKQGRVGEIDEEPVTADTQLAPGNTLASYVHFAINPRHIFWEDFKSDSDPTSGIDDHFIAPGLRLGHLDWMEQVGPGDSFINHPENAVMWRDRGEIRWYTPEQFAWEWDNLRINQRDKPQDVAGRYGPQTNLFQIGLVMFGLITGAQPPHPPQLRPLRNGPANATTYGSALYDTQYDYLKTAAYNVAAILAKVPKHRPTTGTLLKSLNNGIRDAEAKLTSPEKLGLKRWIEAYIREPLPSTVNNTKNVFRPWSPADEEVWKAKITHRVVEVQVSDKWKEDQTIDPPPWPFNHTWSYLRACWEPWYPPRQRRSHQEEW